MGRFSNPRMWRPISIFLMVLLAASTAAGRIIYVDADATSANDGSSWVKAYRHLQDSLVDANAAEKPIEIRVAQGVYTPTPYPDSNHVDDLIKATSQTFQLINGVAVRGGYAGFDEPDPNVRDIDVYVTTLSGDLGDDDPHVNDPWDLLYTAGWNSKTVVTGSGTDSTAVLDGFTVSGGHWDTGITGRIDPQYPPRPTGSGAGMDNLAGSPTVIGCTFTCNMTHGWGAGVCNMEGSNPTMVDCVFTKNYAHDKGGGMANFNSSNTELTRCLFGDNWAPQRAGGMYNRKSSPTLIDCVFADNGTAGRGGAMYNDEGTNSTLAGCIFLGNLANNGGGAMYNDEGSSSVLTNCDFKGNWAGTAGGAIDAPGTTSLTNCSFIGNSASGGGGIRVATATLTNCTFAGNRALRWRQSDGSWVFSIGGAVHALGTETRTGFTNCTFSNNWADFGCAIFHTDSMPSLGISNCIFWGSPKQIYDQDQRAQVYCSAVQGGWPGGGNIDADPCFVDPGLWVSADDPNQIAEPNDPNAVWVDGDYHLKSQAGRWDPATADWVQDNVTSPCIDGGNPMSAIRNERFPNGGRINMGAYGGTMEASKSYFGSPVCETVIAGDINGDCKVDFIDFAIMAAHWLEDNSPSGPVTTAYVFQPDPNALVISGGFAGHIHETYSFEGQFKLMVNFDEGTASFEEVDATLSEEVCFLDPESEGFRCTDSLGVLFQMTELVSTDVNHTRVKFALKRFPGFPEADIHLEFIFLDDSVRLVGGFCEPVSDGVCYRLDAHTVPQLAADPEQ